MDVHDSSDQYEDYLDAEIFTSKQNLIKNLNRGNLLAIPHLNTGVHLKNRIWKDI